MNWLKAFVTSTVGRKYVVGFTGLFLCGFLVMHLIGNLLHYAGADVYNEYTHKLHSNPEFLIIAEILLFSAFALHIVISLWLQFGNRAAREQRYALVQSKRTDHVLHPAIPTPDRTMLLTGMVVLMFLIVHISDFKIEWGWTEALKDQTPFTKVKIILSDVTRSLIYLIGSLVLGVHVTHGLQSAFQSLGLNHPKYTPAIRCLSVVFGIVVAVGFGSFPVMAWLLNWGA